MQPIRNAAVLGAGTMGAQIAAHLANVGVPCLLLDLDARVAREGLERARKLKPDPFFTPDAIDLITIGGFETDLARIAEADWIVEAIVERLDLKQALFAKVDAYRQAGAIVSSNTSGIPIAAIAEGRSAAFRRHFLGTHFFNPPRYLRLLEVIPTGDTDPAVVQAISSFADQRLGKGVVVAKDTPNFIANHLGLYGVMRVFDELAAGRFTIEEIDAITGSPLGRPKSAVFRTLDISGLDVLIHVARNLAERSARGQRASTDSARPELVEGREARAGQVQAGETPTASERGEPSADAERESAKRQLAGEDAIPDPDAFRLPPFVEEMGRRGWIGEKAGQGFYRRQPGPDGSEILVLDLATWEYRPRRPVKLPSIDAAQSIEDVGGRIRTLLLGRDRVGEFLRATLGATLVYTARVAPVIAHAIDDVDRAMRWGYGWELGPFETWDAIGIREVLQACSVSEVPPLVEQMLAKNRNTFRDGPVPPAAPDLQILRAAKERGRVVKKNPGASLVDLGDGVLAVEFHSKMNAIGGDTIEMLNAGVREASRNFAALVVGNDAVNFSAGANLMLLLLEAQEGNWDEIDQMVRAFQAATMGLRYADVPSIVAPAGLTLGGGCEIALHADRVQAAAETYMGLVEVGVGLIPAGGGTKELLARSMELVPPDATLDPLPYVRRAFETIAFAKTSTSGPEARRLGYLRDVDEITMNRERLMADAKARALDRVREGYRKPAPRTRIPVGGDSVGAALKLGVHLARRAGRISEHDVVIGRKLAWILAGGSLPHPTLVTEQYLLDLEREAFVSLCGERKTLERIQHTLKTGKVLRN